MRIRDRLGQTQLQIRVENAEQLGMSSLNGIRGAFAGIEGTAVKLLGPLASGQTERPSYIVPYEFIVPVYPSKNQYAYIIEDGPNFGKQCYVWQIQNDRCYCGTTQGKKKFSMEYTLPPTSLCVFFR